MYLNILRYTLHPSRGLKRCHSYEQFSCKSGYTLHPSRGLKRQEAYALLQPYRLHLTPLTGIETVYSAIYTNTSVSYTLHPSRGLKLFINQMRNKIDFVTPYTPHGD